MWFEQRSSYVQPLCIERHPTDGLACPAIPIGRVVLIALFARQVSMHPRPLGTFVLLGGLVRALPIVLGVPPQPGKGVRESGWRLRRGERLAKFVQGHVSLFCSAVQASSNQIEAMGKVLIRSAAPSSFNLVRPRYG